MSETDPVMGFWHKTATRCDYCNRAREQIYVIRDGPTTGKFCGREHYQLAREEMDKDNEKV